MRAGGTRASAGTDAIAGAVEEHRDTYVTRLSSLVREAAASEDRTVRWIARQLESLGCQVEVIAYRASDLPANDEFARPEIVDAGPHQCVVGRLPGRRAGRSLLLFGHHDTEPVTGLETWQHPPFAADVSAGRMIGWGVADDLAGVGIMLCALDAVRRSGAPTGSVIAASAPSKRHARGIVAVLRRGHTADGALYLHPAESGNGLREIKAVTPGLARFRVTIHGLPAPTQEPEHTPVHREAVNPVRAAARLVGALAALEEQLSGETRHPLIETRGPSVSIHIGHVAAGEPGVAARVPDACVVTGSVSFPPGTRPATVMTRVDQVVSAAAADPRLASRPPHVEWLLAAPGAEIAADHPLCAAAARTIARTTGTAPSINPLHPASDIRHPILAGIPCVGVGPRCGNLVQAGGHDEWVDVEDYLRAINVTAHLIVDWCGHGV
ncbi:MAG: M20/M25/M40 family metallo-hydrolase [Armatimonadota bacterium]|nr:M20/M25/M40 family metallo-hydrolase [Armatimonadota bacterium]